MDPVFWSPSSRSESETSCKNSRVRGNIPTLVQKNIAGYGVLLIEMEKNSGSRDSCHREKTL
jgi:hypothetical protein